jgi:hypothetical protein
LAADIDQEFGQGVRFALGSFYKSDEDGRQIGNNMDKPSEAVLTL